MPRGRGASEISENLRDVICERSLRHFLGLFSLETRFWKIQTIIYNVFGTVLTWQSNLKKYLLALIAISSVFLSQVVISLFFVYYSKSNLIIFFLFSFQVYINDFLIYI